MAFTEEELAYLQTKLGSTVNEDTNPAVVDDLEDRYTRLQDVRLVAIEVLRIRVANIADPFGNPLQFAIAGEYSQDGSKNIDFLTKMLSQLEAEAGVPGGSVLTGIPPAEDRWRPGCRGAGHPDEYLYANRWCR